MSIKDQISPTTPQWYAVKCKYRCERRLMIELNAQGIESYVPIQKKVRQYASRMKKSEVALIPSHVFVKIERPQYLPVLQHIHVFQFLNFSGVIVPIPESEMNVMKRVVGEFEDVAIQSTDFVLGETVQVIGGELTGLSGKLVKGGKHNVLIELSSIGIGLQIRIDTKYLMKTATRSALA